ncbi:unnamed protein product [Vitrella brassicaformis CCMP3155]|uniref:[phosphatase 2A protein]-leucine-carboxy methyltransferase n=1 Tax=Vitrella brassicaformis (strain CCMP3155) TaxID=1169540 RepID=A0A0G4EXJ8_VITBC|nr:unnamed protein product [Vitrella brassicaformis CCMP3155]|eukprot:CEM03436.1 unnamed protein product [Vitrella brassicaformis CCMP3155]
MIDDEAPVGNFSMSGDAAVQNTTEDAASSKLSAVRMGYFRDDYLEHFVRRVTRRSPLINRGYYARVAGIRKAIDGFLSCIPQGTTAQIVNLGSGMDTTFFYVNDKPQSVVCFECDFPEVIQRKAHTILRKEPCWKAMARNREDIVQVPGGALRSEPLRMVAADMRQVDEFERQLVQAGFQDDLPTLWLAECVLVYMQPLHSDAIIRWAANAVSKAPSAFVVYEQILPHDAFGRTMVRNLQARGCPLLGIHEYPTLDSQRQRYVSLGFTRCEAADMNDVYDLHLDGAEIARIQRLEIFDELEEWRLIQGHYFIGVALKGSHDEQHRGSLSYLEPLTQIWSTPRPSDTEMRFRSFGSLPPRPAPPPSINGIVPPGGFLPPSFGGPVPIPADPPRFVPSGGMVNGGGGHVMANHVPPASGGGGGGRMMGMAHLPEVPVFREEDEAEEGSEGQGMRD